MPINVGSTPTTAKLRMRARMGRPMLFAALRRAMRTRLAPSEIWLALPACVEPSALKLAFNLPRPSNVVPSRGPSSAATVTVVAFPSLSFKVVVTGTISESNSPCFCAASAFAWESTANWSCFWRGIWYFAATFSDVMPIGMRQAAARSLLPISLLSFFGSTPEAMLYMDIDSTPPPMPTSMTPERMAAAMLATACRPLLHCRFTAEHGGS
mmetsp:Transcript_76580/g.234470  ORF Transcript_76580/g.234470 Transcript_76580/m.234470 type:complete len:211 (+) Transcript_76580:432-1064(+)